MRLRQPSGLHLLCLVELFERLAFGAVLPLFALYVHEHLGRSEAYSIALSSGFLAASYLACLPGGFVADRFLGMAGAVSLGALLITAGWVGLATDASVALWPSLGALLIGQGLVKPNITALVGSLYAKNDHRRETGFSLFYVAVNLGALAGPLLAEWVRGNWGWPAIFVCAAAAMVPALLLLIPTGVSLAKQRLPDETTFSVKSRDDERARLQSMIVLCAVGVLFWLAFQQAGTSLALFAEKQTTMRFAALGKSILLRPGHFAALHAGSVIVLMPLMLCAMRWLRRLRAEPSTPQKMIWGFVFTAGAFALIAGASLRGGDTGRVGPGWLGGCYILLAIGELWLSPMGLSLVTQLAPPRLAGQFAGLWFATIAIGHGLAAGLGLLWKDWPHHRYFAAVTVLSLLAAAILRLRLEALETAIPHHS